MEQHYLITFCTASSGANNFFTTGVIIKQYPGDPYKLLQEILQNIEDNSWKDFKRRIYKDEIGIKNLTKVN